MKADSALILADCLTMKRRVSTYVLWFHMLPKPIWLAAVLCLNALF